MRVKANRAWRVPCCDFARAAPSGLPAPYKALRVPELHPYGQAFLLYMERFSRQGPPANSRPPDRNAESRVNTMPSFQPESLLLLPVGLGVFFMLWVLWNFWLDEHRKR